MSNKSGIKYIQLLKLHRCSFSQTKPDPLILNAYLNPIGMVNPLFNCYMNSCLQLLLGIPELFQYLSHEKYKDLLKKEDDGFWKAMSKLIHENTQRQAFLALKDIQKLSQGYFQLGQQHDTHEFLRYLLSRMQEEINNSYPHSEVDFKSSKAAWEYYRKYNISLIDELLAGQLISTVTCTNCKHTSTTYDPFLDLSLPIVSGKTKNLNDCLAMFQHEEEIDGYKCKKCKLNVKIKKQLSIGKGPMYLVISLKRFELFPTQKKIRNLVDYPLTQLKIKEEYNNEIVMYSLTGIIVHFGHIDSGHYICYTKRGGNWFICDDERITQVKETEVLSKEAYVLLYQKTNQIAAPKL